jgi:adenine nucleotide transporter 17
VNPAITYGAFERLKTWVLKSKGREGGKLSVGEAFLLGVGSKTLATVVTYPYIFVSRKTAYTLASA